MNAIYKTYAGQCECGMSVFYDPVEEHYVFTCGAAPCKLEEESNLNGKAKSKSN